MVPLANSAPLALSFLFQRLKWPVPMSRWRTAKEIRNLLSVPGTRSSTTDALLNYLDRCKTESEVCEILTIVFLTPPVGRPNRTVLSSCIHCPSILADIILERTYGCGIGGWSHAHSGQSPGNFEGGSYFEEHKTAHVPPILSSNLEELENISGHPFCRQWAYEWKVLCDKLGTHYTRYPHYFDDDVLDARAGIMGQYWQRMREVYLSAYLRTLAYAVSEWHMPQRIAEGYCFDLVHGIAGLFDVEPGARPAWLSNYPERFCAIGSEFEPLIRNIVLDAQENGMRLVSLDTPIASSVEKFARFQLNAHLVTEDYELPNDAFLYEKILTLRIGDTFELRGPPAEMPIDEAMSEGITGDEVAICNSLFPLPFGTWQSDYFGLGLTIPAPYTVPGTEICCTNKGIDLVASNGKLMSRTHIWNDDWRPQHPKGGWTRCAVATMLDMKALAAAETRLLRRLAWFGRLRIWSRETEYGEYSESQRTTFVLD